MSNLVELSPGGYLQYNFHPGQIAAYEATERTVAIFAGTQGGKTTFGGIWLYREIQDRGPGDYLIVTPTFPLLEIKLLPEFKRLFERYLQLGQYTGSPIRVFRFSEYGQARTFGASGPDYDTNIYFGYGSEPESLESATVKAAWLDEAGQKKFKLASYEAVMRRLAIHRGRLLITTTPYNLGWLKLKIWDNRDNPDIRVIRFESILNPTFPREEWEEARARLPKWKFDLFYRAIFTRPAGMIYEDFEEDIDKIPRFTIPDNWPRFMGLDFGGVNLAACFYALDPKTINPGPRANWSSGVYYLYRTYHAGNKTAGEHVKELLKNEPGLPSVTVGGSPSEGNWRLEFRAAGLPVKPPDIKEVEIGIDRVTGMHKAHKIKVFDDCLDYLDQKLSYSRPLDEDDNPIEGIEDKEKYHLLDAERYIMGWINRVGQKMSSARVDWRDTTGAPIIAEDVKSNQEIERELEAYEQNFI